MADHSEHIVSARLYWFIWLILIVCTVLTAVVATIDLGKFNTVVALGIATFKATLVALVFMQVKYSSERMTKAILISAVFWLILLLVLSLIDYSSRQTEENRRVGALSGVVYSSHQLG